VPAAVAKADGIRDMAVAQRDPGSLHDGTMWRGGEGESRILRRGSSLLMANGSFPDIEHLATDRDRPSILPKGGAHDVVDRLEQQPCSSARPTLARPKPDALSTEGRWPAKHICDGAAPSSTPTTNHITGKIRGIPMMDPISPVSLVTVLKLQLSSKTGRKPRERREERETREEGRERVIVRRGEADVAVKPGHFPIRG
jgi:hypothetical protein